MGKKMNNIFEKTLTPNELDKREEIIKSLKTKKSDFVKKYGKAKAMGVMYAIATKTAERVAEDVPEPIEAASKCSSIKPKKTPKMIQREHLEATGELLSLSDIQERILQPQGIHTGDPISKASENSRGHLKKQMGNAAETSEIVRSILFNTKE